MRNCLDEIDHRVIELSKISSFQKTIYNLRKLLLVYILKKFKIRKG